MVNATMHDIEKEALVIQLAAEVWQNYCVADSIGAMITEKGLKLCKIDAFAKATGKAGNYQPSQKLIWINTAYYHAAGDNTDSLRETIAHEIAHYLQHRLFPRFSQWHGVEFRFIMQSIGYDGNTFHSMNVASAKAVAKKAKDELFDLD